MICDYCHESYPRINILILPYYIDNKVKTKELQLCEYCFTKIRDDYEKMLNPYSDGALAALTTQYKKLFLEANKNGL